MLQYFICPDIATVKKGAIVMSFKSSIGLSHHPNSEIATSHVYRIKKTRNKGDQKLCVFRVRVHCHILWGSKGWVAAVW